MALILYTVLLVDHACKYPSVDRVQLTHSDILEMFEHGALSASVFYRRHTLLALCELAANAKGVHDPMSRRRIKHFRAVLESMEGNDEIEVTGEAMCDLVHIASAAFGAR